MDTRGVGLSAVGDRRRRTHGGSRHFSPRVRGARRRVLRPPTPRGSPRRSHRCGTRLADAVVRRRQRHHWNPGFRGAGDGWALTSFEGVEIPARTESLRYSFTSGDPNAAAGDWSAAGVQLVLAPSDTEATALVEVLTTGEGWRTQSAAATAASSGPRSRSGHVRFTETSRRDHVAFTSVRQRSTAPLTRTRRRRWPGRALLGSPSERPDRASTPRGRCRCLRARGADCDGAGRPTDHGRRRSIGVQPAASWGRSQLMPSGRRV